MYLQYIILIVAENKKLYSKRHMDYNMCSKLMGNILHIGVPN